LRIHITITDEKGNNFEGITELRKVTRVRTRSITIPAKKPITVAYCIKNLFNEKFFKDPKTRVEVTTKFKQKGFNFKNDAVRKALDRADFLQKFEKNGNRVYVQKYPP
jgi:hypothetical protein